MARGEGWRDHLAKAEKRLRRAGYTVSTYDVRASDFGVPQLRHRVFME